MTDNTPTPLPSRQVARHNELGQPIGPALDWEPCEPPSTTPMEGRFCRLEAADANRHAEGPFEIGHVQLSPRLQRSSAATEAMFLLLRRVFAEAGYRRCEWKCDDLNAP